MARKPHMVPVGGSPGKAKVAPAPTLPASTITITKLNPNTSVHNQMAHVLIDGTYRCEVLTIRGDAVMTVNAADLTPEDRWCR